MLRLRQINLLFHITVIECPYSCIPCITVGITVEKNLKAKWSKSILEEIIMFQERDFVLIIRYKVSQLSSFLLYSLMKSV